MSKIKYQSMATLEADIYRTEMTIEAVESLLTGLVEICKGENITWRVQKDASIRGFRVDITSFLGKVQPSNEGKEPSHDN